MALSVSCHFKRAVMLELNGVFSRDFDGKFEHYCKNFPGELTKKTFRWKLEELMKFVKAKSACVGDIRKLYTKKYGIEAWHSLLAEEKGKHSLKCTLCQPEPLFREPKGFRSKKNNKKKTPVKRTPLKRVHEQMKIFSDQVVSCGKDWEDATGVSYVEAIRKNRTLNLTPRKSKSAKERNKRMIQKKVTILVV